MPRPSMITSTSFSASMAWLMAWRTFTSIEGRARTVGVEHVVEEIGALGQIDVGIAGQFLDQRRQHRGEHRRGRAGAKLVELLRAVFDDLGDQSVDVRLAAEVIFVGLKGVGFARERSRPV